MRNVLTVGIFALASQCCQAQTAAERLVVTPPGGFKVVQEVKLPDISLTEMVPSSQSLEVWTERFATSVMPDRSGSITPASARAEAERRWRESYCKDDVKTTVISESRERGFQTTTWFQQCGADVQTSKPILTWYKMIRGPTAVHMVWFTFRATPPADLAAKTRIVREAYLEMRLSPP